MLTIETLSDTKSIREVIKASDIFSHFFVLRANASKSQIAGSAYVNGI